MCGRVRRHAGTMGRRNWCNRTAGLRSGETGLDYFGARYFSGAQGRFTSADTPFADQYLHDPQSWNLYEYARNNPLRYIDDDGEAGALRALKGTDAFPLTAVGRSSGSPGKCVLRGDPWEK